MHFESGLTIWESLFLKCRLLNDTLLDFLCYAEINDVEENGIGYLQIWRKENGWI